MYYHEAACLRGHRATGIRFIFWRGGCHEIEILKCVDECSGNGIYIYIIMLCFSGTVIY